MSGPHLRQVARTASVTTIMFFAVYFSDLVWFWNILLKIGIGKLLHKIKMCLRLFMLGLLVFLYFVITNRTGNNCILDFIEVVLSPFLNFLWVVCSIVSLLFRYLLLMCLTISFSLLSAYIACLIVLFKFLKLLHYLTFATIFSSFHYSIYIYRFHFFKYVSRPVSKHSEQVKVYLTAQLL